MKCTASTEQRAADAAPGTAESMKMSNRKLSNQRSTVRSRGGPPIPAGVKAELRAWFQKQKNNYPSLKKVRALCEELELQHSAQQVKKFFDGIRTNQRRAGPPISADVQKKLRAWHNKQEDDTLRLKMYRRRCEPYAKS